MKKGGRVMLIILSALLTCILIAVVVLFILSPGKSEAFLDKNTQQDLKTASRWFGGINAALAFHTTPTYRRSQ